MTADTIAVRNCTELEEFRECLALQKEVWGFADNELVPLRIFSLAPKIGGQVIGAWDGGTLAGFALSIPGMRNGHAYLHSHMLGVKDGYRNGGLGRSIKLFQREDAVAHGYELMEWTFDPPLQHQSVWDYVVAATGFSSHGPAGRRVVVDIEARRDFALHG